MTIDEGVRFCNEKSKNIKLKADPEVFTQLAEWLKELKAYREQHQTLCDSYDVNTVEDIYDKAIDDVVKAADKQCGYYAGECKNLTRDDILKIAKELKDNG